MDFKALRAKRNDKARSLIESSGGKVDSSDWTPSELLNTEAKTGMRPISRRAFKAGGKVEGAEAKTNLSRASRGFKETVGLANTNQKDANEEREGKKHVGGFKKGGRVAKDGGGMTTSLRPKPRPEDLMTKYKLDSIFRSGEAPPDEPRRPQRRPSAEEMEQQAALDRANASAESEGRDREMFGRKKGGMVEGSAKDKREDKALAKKHGMSMKEWEKSPEDKAHDKGCACKACGGAAMKKDGGGLYANINAKRERIESGSKEKMRKPGSKGAPTAEAFKMSARTAKKDGGKADGDADDEQFKHPYFGDSRQYKGKKWDESKEKWVAKSDKDDRMARATGGRAGKGKTNIVINVMPHTANKPVSGIQPPMPPMPPVGGPPPMAPPTPPMRLPPGLGAAMAGAAGAGPMPPPGGPGGPGPMPPMMARKSGGKVYPKMHFGSGGGKGRLEKIEEYGNNA